MNREWTRGGRLGGDHRGPRSAAHLARLPGRPLV